MNELAIQLLLKCFKHLTGNCIFPHYFTSVSFINVGVKNAHQIILL